jgi:hypothetical protein
LYVAVLLSKLNMYCHCVYLRKINASKNIYKKWVGQCLYLSGKHANHAYQVNQTKHHCYVLPENLIPRRDLNPSIQLLMRMRCPLCHATQGNCSLCIILYKLCLKDSKSKCSFFATHILLTYSIPSVQSLIVFIVSQLSFSKDIPQIQKKLFELLFAITIPEE